MKKFFRHAGAILGISLAILLNCALITPTLGADTPPPIIPGGTNQALKLPHLAGTEPSKDYLQNQLLPNITAVIIGITGGVSLVFAVLSGIQLLTSYGNPTQSGNAKKSLGHIATGLIISGLSYAIVKIISAIYIK